MKKIIYFIQQKVTKAIKIGITDDISVRLNSLKTASPYDLVVLATVYGSEDDEKYLHNKFSRYRLNGEWFRFNKELIEFIKDVKSNIDKNPHIEKANVEFKKLSKEQKTILLNWINYNFTTRKSTENNYSSYGLKHFFEFSDDGFYITNEQFKGAMLKAGHKPNDVRELNWLFFANYIGEKRYYLGQKGVMNDKTI